MRFCDDAELYIRLEEMYQRSFILMKQLFYFILDLESMNCTMFTALKIKIADRSDAHHMVIGDMDDFLRWLYRLDSVIQ